MATWDSSDAGVAHESHYLYSSYREKLLEHLFLGELLKHFWKQRVVAIDVLRPDVDHAGIDIVIAKDGATRFIQLKASRRGGRAAHQKVNRTLDSRPGGCVIWMYFDDSTLDLGPFLWFGAESSIDRMNLCEFSNAKHTKGNAVGKKLERPNICRIPKGRFEKLETIGEVSEKLFGI